VNNSEENSEHSSWSPERISAFKALVYENKREKVKNIFFLLKTPFSEKVNFHPKCEYL